MTWLSISRKPEVHNAFISRSYEGCIFFADGRYAVFDWWGKETVRMSFGAKFRVLREAKGLPRAGIDEWFNLMPGTVSNWENGFQAPEEELLPDLASFFGVRISDLTDEAAWYFRQSSEKGSSVWTPHVWYSKLISSIIKTYHSFTEPVVKVSS